MSDEEKILSNVFANAVPKISSPGTKTGNPSPLGMFAFALTTFIISLYTIQVREITHPDVFVGVALFYGGFVQLLAGMWEFKVGNTFSATACCSYGAYWISFATILMPGFNITSAYTTKSELNQALGIFLLGWTIFAFLLFVASFKSKASILLLNLSVIITFSLLTASKFLENIDIEKAGGFSGVITALLAWYNAMDQFLTEENSYFTLPNIDLSRKNK
ncbi:12397_t:CDS:2 [Ambispora leptoticha]|uniref:12397_t:CDS:1 n=1 Tax=Ambispora leptoticha TaxID=144679 RepID=A0A9N9AEN4_9GLOM|nr:12397_t:CDS:2 [Ambispora leptoticha]